MRECQLCGAKSWGPLEQSGRALFLATFAHPTQTVVDSAAYRQCDNCNMPAWIDIIEKPVSVPELRLSELPHIADAIFGGPSISRGPDPMTVAKEALEGMASRMPQPETRLERIMRALCGNVPLRKPTEFSDVQDCEAYASTICLIATLIEKRLSESAP